MSDLIIEKDWITESGLRAVAVIVRKSHRCGLVGIGDTHPLYGVGYCESCSVLLPACNPIIPPSPMDRFIVHGGLTYSGSGEDGIPVPSDLWWFGFDCAHAGDAYFPEYYKNPDKTYGYPGSWKYREGQVLRSLEYVINECESLARQIQRYAT